MLPFALTGSSSLAALQDLQDIQNFAIENKVDFVSVAQVGGGVEG